jgi:hypothetical protein
MIVMTDLTMPVVRREVNINLLIASFTYIMEDRRPDISSDSEDVKTLGYKYKHQFKIRMLFSKYSFVIHSINPGYYNREEK